MTLQVLLEPFARGLQAAFRLIAEQLKRQERWRTRFRTLPLSILCVGKEPLQSLNFGNQLRTIGTLPVHCHGRGQLLRIAGGMGATGSHKIQFGAVAPGTLYVCRWPYTNATCALNKGSLSTIRSY